MPTPVRERLVSRVLVLLQYPNQPDGDVFDLTALTRELAGKGDSQHALLKLEVTASNDYSAERSAGQPFPLKTEASWYAMVNFQSSGESGFLEDAINASLPDSMATEELRKKLRKVQAKAEQLTKDIQAQRLFDAAAVRHQHPIARLTEHPLATQPPPAPLPTAP